MNLLSVTSLTSIGATTVQVKFKADFIENYKAGQYIVLLSPITRRRYYFSIASAPLSSGEICIHIGSVTQDSIANRLVSELQIANEAYCEGVGGKAYLRENDRPMVMIVGGSGYTYARALLHQELRSQRQRSITLIWGGKDRNALYELETLNVLSSQIERLHFIPVIAHESSEFNGYIGNLLTVSYKLPIDFSQADLYVCGRPEMVKACKRYLCKYKQLESENFYSDAS